jgi:hypothetical protein
MKTEDAKFECDALARRTLTKLTELQLSDKQPKAKKLPYTFNKAVLDY